MDQYVKELPAERREMISAVREVVRVTVNDAEREDDSGRVGVFVSLGESESDGV